MELVRAAVGLGLIFTGTLFLTKILHRIYYAGLIKVIFAYGETRSKYKWTWRSKTKPWLRSIGDYIFNLNEDASVDAPTNLVESVVVTSASLTRKNCSIQVVNEVNSLLQDMTECGTIEIPIRHLLRTLPFPEDDCSLDIEYKGHADPSRKIPAGHFAVKYRAKVDSTICFPPYSANEKIKKGFKANKIIYARAFHNKDLTSLAKTYGGLKANFYEDVSCQHVQKNYIDHKEVHVLISEDGCQRTKVVGWN